MKLCITGGGTGGHLMIAKTLVQTAKKRGHTNIFIGSTSGQDRKYFEVGSEFDDVYFLQTTGIVNQKGFKKIIALVKVIKAFFQARKILKTHNIEAIYSVGGFSAAPASLAALSLKIPLFIHEQNSVTGRLNALLKPYAKGFICAYDATSPIQGYPVDTTFFQKARVRKKIHTIIFLGGSHGAKTINDFAIEVAPYLFQKNIHIIHQCGEFDFHRVQQAYKDLNIEVELYGFTKKLDTLITKADFAVSRAGASTLWELTSNGCPALFIPYPYAAKDHQYHNAQFLVQNDMAWCQRENDMQKLKTTLFQILDEDLEQKSKKLLQHSYKNVADKMIELVEKEVQK